MQVPPLLERNQLGRQLFEAMGAYLEAQGLKVSRGTMVDATILNAPSSTKNAAGARDPEMHQTKKGNQWYFGMKAHFGVVSQVQAHPLGRGHPRQRARQPGPARAAARK